MTRRLSETLPLEHPEILAIAFELMLYPNRRTHYSALVLTLADAAMDRIRKQLATPPPVRRPFDDATT